MIPIGLRICTAYRDVRQLKVRHVVFKQYVPLTVFGKLEALLDRIPPLQFISGAFAGSWPDL